MVISGSQLTKTGQAPLQKGGRLLGGFPGEPADTPAGYAALENVSKAGLVRIAMNQLPREIPDFQAPGATKDTLIAQWLTAWIQASVASGQLTENHLLPRKADIAQYLGVSVGTVQNAIRYIEDNGVVESKQRIGTLIRGGDHASRMRKQTSKREQAVVAIQQFILNKGFQPGESLPSAREIAKVIGSAPNTTRLALEYLSSQGILESRGTRGNKANWALNTLPDVEASATLSAIESETLIDQLERDLKQMVADRYEVDDKLPSHLELAELFKVSIKTVHDAMKRLSDQGVLHSRRGRYGTYVLRKPDANPFFAPTETPIFLPAQEATFYNYEKVEGHLKSLIRANYQVGDKLPAMGKLSEELGVSSNTIRKALQNLAQQGVVVFSRGRYGGTFIAQIPEETGSKTFTWVSINPETIKSYRSTQAPA